MTTPGLTCATCDRPFAGKYARRTERGWVHAKACPKVCTIDGCDRKHQSRGLCAMHYKRRQNGIPMHLPTPVRITDQHIEDVEWMAETGESLIGAAARIGTTTDSLEQSLRRRGHRDLLRRLLAQNPHDWNTPSVAGGVIKAGYNERRAS